MEDRATQSSEQQPVLEPRGSTCEDWSTEDWAHHKVDVDSIKKVSRRSVVRFYKHQNEIIDHFLKVQHPQDDTRPDDEENPPKDIRSRVNSLGKNSGIYLSFFANLCLLVVKLVVAFTSGSIAILASALDSFLDILSNIVLVLSARYMSTANPASFPVGKSRIEPLGVIVFASLMLALSFSVIIQSAQRLIFPEDVVLSMIEIIVLIAVIVCKGALFLYCRLFPYPSVQALALDHLNDVCSNTVGLGAAVASVYWQPFMDPVGAILISLYIIVMWGRTLLSHIIILAGRSAPKEFVSLITFMAARHPGVIKVDRVSAWHIGLRFLVEVDVMLDPAMPLRQAHDIGESLQVLVEENEQVERCFVHLDYETEHKASMEHKVLL